MGRFKRFLPACLLVLAACGSQVGDTEAGIHIGDGPIENNHCEGVVDPGSRAPANFFDVTQTVPSNLRSFSVTSAEGTSDRPTGEPLIGTFDEGRQLRLEMDTRFFANTRTDEDACDFYRNVCRKHECWTDEGWLKMLNETFYTPLKTTINEVGPDHNANEVRYEKDAKDAFVEDVASGFADNQEELLGKGTYFCGGEYDREDEDTGCPAISIQLVDAKFVCRDEEDPTNCLEDIPNQRELARQQESLAADQAEAARAQQAVADAKNTPAQVEQRRLDIEEKCAENGCVMITNGSGTNVGVSVPTG